MIKATKPLVDSNGRVPIRNPVIRMIKPGQAGHPRFEATHFESCFKVDVWFCSGDLEKGSVPLASAHPNGRGSKLKS